MIEAQRVAYGEPAARALHQAIVAIKQSEPLAPVTVIVPNNHVGVAARRRLGSGQLGPVTAAGVGLAGVMFATTYRLGEMLGAPLLAGSGRRPVSTPVTGAAVRSVLRAQPGMFERVASHPTTERSLVQAHRELREVSAEGLAALAALGRRASEVVRIHRAVTQRLSAQWYDEVDLLHAATSAIDDGSTVVDDLGPLVIHLPQLIRPSSATLLRIYAQQRPVSVIAGFVGDQRADAPVERSLGLLDIAATDAPVDTARPAVVRVVDTSDADDEVRQVVRGVVDAARQGTPLERMAVLYAADDPYARTLHEQLAAAGIAHNGAAVRTAATSLFGRSLLAMLALPDGGYRRDEVMAWLASAPVHDDGRLVPSAAWDRVSRRSGVVAGAEQWLDRLERHSDDRREAAERLDAESDARAERYRREAAWALSLRVFIGRLVDDLDPKRSPLSWSALASWVRGLGRSYLGDDTTRRTWPESERRAAERVEAALDRLAGLDLIDEAPSASVFRRTLEIELDTGLGRVGRFGDGVLAGRLDLGLGLDLDELFVLGAAEGTLPSRGREDSLLPDRERAFVPELAPRGERVDDEHRMLLAAVASANRVTLVRARGDLRRSVERVESRWVAELCAGADCDRRSVASFASTVTTVDFPATDQEYNLRRLAVAGADGPVGAEHPDVAVDPVMARGYAMTHARRSHEFTRFDGNLSGASVDSPTDSGVVTSPTRLEAWARCPFAYFMEHVLHVQPLDRPEALLAVSPLDRGNIVHQVLDQFVVAVLERSSGVPVPGQGWTDDDRRMLADLGRTACDAYEERGLTGKAVYWRRDRARLLAELDAFLDSDEGLRAGRRSRPVASELRFGIGAGHSPVAVPLGDGRSISFRGSADRVDVTADGGLLVLDYKTGSANSYRGLGPDDPHQHGTRLQLGVYAHAARAAFGDADTPVEADYWFVSAKGGYRLIGYEVTAEAERQIADALVLIADGIGAGAFPAYPLDLDFWISRNGPSADPFRLSTTECRTAWMTKRDDPLIAGFRQLAESEDRHV